MPTERAADGTPIVRFDVAIEVSPFDLLRRLGSADPPLLVDARERAGELTLEGAVPWPGTAWTPPDDADTVLFDDDGSRAPAVAVELRRQGHERVRALFGGLELYAFCLDPDIVGTDTYLRRRQPS
ncbi:MAG: rhodanese-like domain-containing protein [Thermoanaerobaculia bacterium]